MHLLNALLANIGAILGIWGIVWGLWDYNARQPLYILLTSITCLLTSGGVSYYGG